MESKLMRDRFRVKRRNLSASGTEHVMFDSRIPHFFTQGLRFLTQQSLRLSCSHQCRSRITKYICSPRSKSTKCSRSRLADKYSLRSSCVPVLPFDSLGSFKKIRLIILWGQVAKWNSDYIRIFTKHFLPELVCFCIRNSKSMTPLSTTVRRQSSLPSI